MTDWNKEARQYIPEFKERLLAEIPLNQQKSTPMVNLSGMKEQAKRDFDVSDKREGLSTFLLFLGATLFIISFSTRSWICGGVAVLCWIFSLLFYPRDFGERTDF